MTDPHMRGGGQVRYVSNLARELTRLGHRVLIGCKPGSVLEAHAREAACEVFPRLVLRGGVRPNAWLHDVWHAQRLLRSFDPSVIHVSGSQDHWVFAIANRFLGGHPRCIVRTRHNTYAVADNPPNRALNRDWTDYQIVVCNTVRESLGKQSGFDPARMCSIHNGVDADAYHPDMTARQAIRAEFGYSENHIVCGIAARLVAAKGHKFLFQAAAQLQGEIPQLRLLVLGQGDLENDLRLMTKQLNIRNIVRFTGFRDDMAACVQAFDMGVQPSIDCDTSSFSLKEQMAAEKPVIASDYGGLTEIVTEGVEGLVVPAGSVEPLARAIRALALRPDLRLRMGRAGRQRVLRDFTIQIFASRTVDAYYRAMEIHHERAARR